MRLLRKRIRGFFALQAIALLLSLGASLVTQLRTPNAGSLYDRITLVVAYFGLSLIFFKAWATTHKTSPFRNRWAMAASCVSFGWGCYFFWVGHSSLGPACRALITLIIGAVGFAIFCQGPNWRDGEAQAALRAREASCTDAGEIVAK
jgi:hypothetical protein